MLKVGLETFSMPKFLEKLLTNSVFPAPRLPYKKSE